MNVEYLRCDPFYFFYFTFISLLFQRVDTKLSMQNFVEQITQGYLDFPGGGKGEVKVVLSGDFCPVNRVETLCREGNSAAVYNEAIVLLQDGDIRITNLECPLTDKASPIPKNGPNLMAHPDCIEALCQGEFDVVTLANNHIMDQGTDGLSHTIAACKQSGIQTVGAGNNLREAAQPLLLNIKNVRIAILNFAEKEFAVAGHNRPGANPLDPVQNYYQIKAARQQADLVFLVIHGGNEHAAVPSPRMVKMCRFFADLGVAAIICHHTHRAGGLELYKGTPIFYSLGNFVFDYPVPSGFSHWYEGYWIAIHINKKALRRIEIHPYVQCREDVGLHLMQGEDKVEFLKKIKKYSLIIQNENLLSEYWASYCQQKRLNYLSSTLRLNKLQRLLLRRGLLFKNKKNQKHLLRLFNMFCCEAHRDVIMEVFQKEIDQLK